MKTLYRRSLSALLALLLAGQMVPAALASPEPEASKTPEEIVLQADAAAADEPNTAPPGEPPADAAAPAPQAEAAAGELNPGDVAITPESFPDDIFRSWLLSPANLSGSGTDGVFTPEELANIRDIFVPNLGISSLQGIQVFSALENLSCGGNALTQLDVRQNKALESLRCAGNRLTKLDVSGLEQLSDLVCEENYLQELILTGCTALENLYARNNSLTTVDFSDNGALIFLEIFSNKLEEVDLSMLTRLEFAHLDHNQLTHLDLSRNGNLRSIGSGFVARNNFLETLTLPDHSDLVVDPDVYQEQDPKTGYTRVEWYADPTFTQPVTGPVAARGQTLYAKWLPNDYTIRYDAAGGSGSAADQGAVWGETVTLAENSFTRRGYTFTGWENRYGNGKVYAPGETVTNLSGKQQGDRVTLYAKWEPISYTVVFDAGAGSGAMAPVSCRYDQETALPANTLTPPPGKEFAGWALQSGGPIRFGDGDAVWNLAATSGAAVTLYATWRDPVRNTYLRQLEKAYSGYQAADYTTRDWETLVSCYDAAQRAVEQGQREPDMQSACAQGLQNMSAVPTCAVRAEAVHQAWQSAHSKVIALCGKGAVDEARAGSLLQAAADAANGCTVSFTGEVHPDLTLPADLEQITALAGDAARDTLRALEELAQAAAWAQNLGGLSTRPLPQVTSQHLAQYDRAAAESAAYAKELTAAVRDALTARAALARAKQQAVERLTKSYQSYAPDRYTPQGLEQLEGAFRTGAAQTEAAASPEAVTAALQDALAALNAVPQKGQANGGASGGSGGGGGGGAASGVPETAPVPPAPVMPEEAPWFADVPETFWARNEIDWAREQGFMQGTGEGTFSPGGTVTRQQIWMILARLGGADPADMGAARSWTVSAGISDGSAPGAAVTRQQLAVLLCRFARRQGSALTAGADLSGFSDASSVAPYAREAMAWTLAAGIFRGSGDGTLTPNAVASRAQTAVLLYRFCQTVG